MAEEIAKFQRNLAIATRTALVVTATVLVAAALRLVLNGLFDGRWNLDWLFVLELSGVFALAWFFIVLTYTYIKLRANAPFEAIFEQHSPEIDNEKTALSGFVAMEYYGLFMNRTFVVFVSPDGLYGWKAEGTVTSTQSMYFEPYAEMLRDPELMQNMESVRRLSNLRGGFFIPRSDIISSDVLYKEKWGMGTIPQSGRIRLRLVSGKSREFILPGNVDADSIRQSIMLGTVHVERIPGAPRVSLPYVARYSKKLWVPLVSFWMALSAYFAWNFNSNWNTATWGLRIGMLLMIGAPFLLLLEFVIQNTRFTDTEIQQTTRFGGLITVPYSSIQRLATARDAFLNIELSDGRILKLYTWQGNPREVLAILQTKTGLTIVAA